MAQDLKHISTAFEVKSLDEGGHFEGYASVFGNQDYDGDVIVKGAFRKTIEQYRQASRMPKMLWQHDMHEIVGKWQDMHEDEHGLYVRGSLILDTQKGREAYALMKAGVLDGMSIGFNVAEARPSEQRSRGRVIEEVDLWEVSLVTWGANPAATVTSVKSAKQSIRDFERFLRDAGFSKSEAKAVASDGYKALETRRDVGDSEGHDDDTELKAALMQLSNTMEVSHGD